MLLLLACVAGDADAVPLPEPPSAGLLPTGTVPESALLPANSPGATVAEAFPPPAGARRLPADAFGAYLQALPLFEPGHPVHTYDGGVVDMPAARVIALSVEGEPALQCADSALRLRATWERSVGRSPAFHYTSGDLSRWSDWAAGSRPRVKGNDVTWVAGAARADASDASFGRWLSNLYQYAGTWSLPRDTKPVPPAADGAVGAVAPGDLLVTPGSPGHAVVILDVAQAEERRWVLVGQGYMPAMEFHVVEGPDGGWFPVEGEELPTAPIPMPWTGLRRWK